MMLKKGVTAAATTPGNNRLFANMLNRMEKKTEMPSSIKRGTGWLRQLADVLCESAGAGAGATGARPCAPLALACHWCARGLMPASRQRLRRHMGAGCGRVTAIKHNAGDYTQPRRQPSQPDEAAPCGPSSYNPHYVVRPRVRPFSPAQRTASPCCQHRILPQPRSRRRPWRLRCRSAASSSCESP